MFHLLSMVAKKPILTKLDDDGETQMDMCMCPSSLSGSTRAFAPAWLPSPPFTFLIGFYLALQRNVQCRMRRRVLTRVSTMSVSFSASVSVYVSLYECACMSHLNLCRFCACACVRELCGVDIDMPGNTGTGNYWDPPGGEACCGGTY